MGAGTRSGQTVIDTGSAHTYNRVAIVALPVAMAIEYVLQYCNTGIAILDPSPYTCTYWHVPRYRYQYVYTLTCIHTCIAILQYGHTGIQYICTGIAIPGYTCTSFLVLQYYGIPVPGIEIRVHVYSECTCYTCMAILQYVLSTYSSTTRVHSTVYLLEFTCTGVVLVALLHVYYTCTLCAGIIIPVQYNIAIWPLVLHRP